MLFTEPAFLFLFLPLLLLLYFVIPARGERSRNALLTVASLVFYAAGEWTFLPWLLASTAVNYFIALALDRWREPRLHRALLTVGIASDLGLLVAFKYADFFVGSLNRALAHFHGHPLVQPHLALPLGISFFTFHKISYKIDVARGTAQVRKQPIDLLLYILLFPQLIAGPIVRYHDIAEDLVKRHIRLPSFAEGVQRFVVGLGKKMLVANSVALSADSIFALTPAQLSAPMAWLGALAYTLQIYFDFSGYSDMAWGLARMFGFHFPENFDYPYISQSITEFWRRWHMSLSRWFRDYLYIPLGGNRGSRARTYFNLSLVFLLCGLWHGAKWTFVAWGLFHGFWLVVERAGGSAVLARMPRPVRHALTLFLVMVGWVLFRAENLHHALAFLRAMAGLGPRGLRAPGWETVLNPQIELGLLAGFVGSTPLVALAIRALRGESGVGAVAWGLLGNVALAAVLALSLTQIAAGTYNPFIYFRF